jgi:23S rRNA (pseudouridine1915-N3)-methyltransferase
VRITIVAAGKLKAGPEHDLTQRYLKMSRWPIDLVEIDDRKAGAADRMRRAIPTGSIVVALDGRGEQISSETLAKKLGAWRDQGRDVTFLIGPADGIDPALRKSADATFAFGAATWPHLLARVLLAEQLYRAHTILTGHPYHRGG